MFIVVRFRFKDSLDFEFYFFNNITSASMKKFKKKDSSIFILCIYKLLRKYN